MSSSDSVADAGAKCPGYEPIESLAAKLSLLLAHVATLAALFTCVRMMYDKVQIKHPVFAVVFQEIMALCTCEAVTYVFLLVMIGDDNETWKVLSMSCSFAALQFHQVFWLCITAMRCVIFSQG